MKPILPAIALITVFCLPLFSQTNEDSANKVKISTYYKLGLQYKSGNGVPLDYTKAFANFSKAASLGDPQSIYAVAYMQYKGLGCTQDYNSAAVLFAQGAALGKDNSLYFYGLCWRNGYGVTKNEDSAEYYLNKAAALGYKQAIQELKAVTAENSNDSAYALVQQIQNAAIPNQMVLNQYNRIEHHLPSSNEVSGKYTGYLIQYDWSGTHIISSRNLTFILSADNSSITGQWVEEACDTVNIQSVLTSDSVLFRNTKYRRKDHYSFDTTILYNFSNARLNFVQQGDSLYLAGNVGMFSPERNEPSKPMFVALSRSLPPDLKFAVNAYPNPFSNQLTVDFKLPQAMNVEIQLLALNGTMLYRNTAGLLEAGEYALPVQISNQPSGTYLVKIIQGKQATVVKVVKE